MSLDGQPTERDFSTQDILYRFSGVFISQIAQVQTLNGTEVEEDKDATEYHPKNRLQLGKYKSMILKC